MTLATAAVTVSCLLRYRGKLKDSRRRRSDNCQPHSVEMRSKRNGGGKRVEELPFCVCPFQPRTEALVGEETTDGR